VQLAGGSCTFSGVSVRDMGSFKFCETKSWDGAVFGRIRRACHPGTNLGHLECIVPGWLGRRKVIAKGNLTQEHVALAVLPRLSHPIPSLRVSFTIFRDA
jgi:hypothetical protein